jgi:hypothetical protein
MVFGKGKKTYSIGGENEYQKKLNEILFDPGNCWDGNMGG